MTERVRETRTIFDPDLRLSPKPVIAGLAVMGFALAYAAESPPFAPVRLPAQILANLSYALSAAAWLASEWRPRVGQWGTIMALVVVVALASVLMQVPSALALLSVPTGLAVALIGLPGAVGAAFAETVLLFSLSKLGVTQPNPAATTITLLTIWGTIASMLAVHRPVLQLSDWLQEHFQRAQSLLEEAREHRAELEQALDDLAQANRQLSLSSERMAMLRQVAEEAEQTKTAFVAKVSHEFRTPLNMIIGLVELMVETPQIYAVTLPPDMEEDLEVVLRNCKHLSSMIDDVLDLTRVETGRLSLHREQVDLAEIVREAALAVRPLVDKKGIDLHVEIPGDLPTVNCDRTRIRQVILNLTSNAARFTEAGVITISVTHTDSHVKVSVTDTGPGIAPEDAERIFEPFCQGRNDVWRDKGGSGLGLSISRQFVRLHHGRMWLESEPGVGSSFIFELPISPPVEHVFTPNRWIRKDWMWRENAFRTLSARVSDQAGRPRLVIYDRTGGFSPELTRYSDEMEFVKAESLEEATHLVKGCPAAAVLINTGVAADLPSLVEDAVKSIEHTPVIGCCIPQPVERVIAAGALGYLTKPVSRADLEQVLQEVDRPVRRVLLVDDDPDVLRLFARMLCLCDETLDIASASNGKEALDTLRAMPIDLVLLDVVMPDMDGWQVLEQMRRDPEIRDVPVFLVSAQDLIDKPLESKLLLASIDQGFSINKLLRCSLELSSILLQPDRRPDLTLPQTDEDGQASAGRVRHLEPVRALAL